MGKIYFSSSLGNLQEYYLDENTRNMFDRNKILQNEENVQWDFCKTIVEKYKKKIKIKGEKKENQLLSNLQKQLRERNLKLVMCVEMEVASFELLHINCMTISHNVRKLGKKLCRKLLKTQIDMEILLQEVSINTFQTYQQIENGLIMLLYRQAQRPSSRARIY